VRRGRRELALPVQRRPPGRPRARLSRRPRHRTVRHHRRAAGTTPGTGPAAQTQRRRAHLSGRRPGPVGLPLRTPLAASGHRPAGAPVPLCSGQAADNRRLRRAAPLVAEILHTLATCSPSWCDQWRLLDATPVPCGASRQTVRRSELAGWAGYGWTAATAAGTGASSCMCWPARTAWQWPGALPTPATANVRSPRAVGPGRPPTHPAASHGRPGRQGPGRPRLRPDRGRPGCPAGPARPGR
jgi:hypothetical protein